jgi:hypothetical protein
LAAPKERSYDVLETKVFVIAVMHKRDTARFYQEDAP